MHQAVRLCPSPWPILVTFYLEIIIEKYINQVHMYFDWISFCGINISMYLVLENNFEICIKMFIRSGLQLKVCN